MVRDAKRLVITEISDFRQTPWHSPQQLVNEKNTDGDRIGSQSIGDPPGDGTWYPMSLTLDTEGLITVSVAGETTDYDPGTDWRETELLVELSGNGWGNGHAVGVAFDQFSLERP